MTVHVRRLTTSLIVAAVAVMLNDPASHSEDTSPSADVSGLAAAIARTMSATNPASANNPDMTQQVTAHANVVETRMAMTDQSRFAKMRETRTEYEQGLTHFMCQPNRLAYIRKGVKFHYVVAGPNSESFEFQIDTHACDAVTATKGVDAAGLAGLSRTVANDLTEALATNLDRDGFRLDKATDRGGRVSVVQTVTSRVVERFFSEKPVEAQGIMQGWLCGKVGKAVRQGIILDVVLKHIDGSVLKQFVIGPSDC